jgi:Lon protease-like protein
MSWFGKQKPAKPVAEILNIPLFPLGSVLFPGGTMALKVFEKRYLDMAAACMKQETPFGICLILRGKEVGETAVPYSIGTLAHVSSWDMEQLGILQLGVFGGRRFRILASQADVDGLLHAEVELLPEPDVVPVPEAQRGLLPILEKIAGDLGPERMPLPHNWNDAAWVGYRLTEVVPVQPLAKQKLLELDDAVSRLEILFKYLAQRGLVK